MDTFDNRQDEANEVLQEFGVSPDEACPDCHENRIDWLAWDDDGEYVTCSSCGCVYVP